MHVLIWLRPWYWPNHHRNCLHHDVHQSQSPHHLSCAPLAQAPVSSSVFSGCCLPDPLSCSSDMLCCLLSGSSRLDPPLIMPSICMKLKSTLAVVMLPRRRLPLVIKGGLVRTIALRWGTFILPYGCYLESRGGEYFDVDLDDSFDVESIILKRDCSENEA